MAAFAEAEIDHAFAAVPALWAALSPLGRSLRLPANFLPQQTAEARGAAFNATIGQITDGRGGAVPLPSMAAVLSGLDPADRSRAFLYSPVEGLAELRERWRERQRRGQPEERPSSLPMVTAGPMLGLSVAADLFLAPDRAAVVPADEPLLAEVVTLRTGARLLPLQRSDAGRLDVATAFAALPEGEPALFVLPGGAAADPADRERLAGDLARAAERRPVVAVAYDGDDAGAGSLFWSLVGRQSNLVALSIDVPPDFAGGALGFLTFGRDPADPATRALEDKAKILLRATVGSPSATTQVLLLQALRAGL